jgi:hypothetical protein
MHHPGAGSLHIPPASIPSNLTSASPTSSLTPPSLNLNRRFVQLEQERISHCYSQLDPQPKHKEELKTPMSSSTQIPQPSGNQSPTQIANRWNAPLPLTKSSGSTNKYPNNLTPAPSPLCPMCTAVDRLRLWKPAPAISKSDTHHLLPEEEQEHIKDLLTTAWQESTRTSYATGLLTYHIFCNERNLSEETRAPACTDLIIAFVSALAGSLAGSTINNYISGIRTWHIIHHITWNIDHTTIDTALRTATVSAPPSNPPNPRDNP